MITTFHLVCPYLNFIRMIFAMSSELMLCSNTDVIRYQSPISVNFPNIQEWNGDNE